MEERIEANIILYNSMLAIILRLLHSKEPLVFTPNDYKGSFKDVVMLVQEIKGLFPEVTTSKLFPIDKVTDKVEMQLFDENKESLYKVLAEYFAKYTNNKLISDTENIPWWPVQQENFVKSIIGTRADNIIVKEVEHMHVLLFEILTGNIFVHNISLAFNNDVEKIFDFKVDEPWNDNFIKCNIRINAVKYLEKHLTKKKEEQKQKDKIQLPNNAKVNRTQLKTLKIFLEYTLEKIRNCVDTISLDEFNSLRVNPLRKAEIENDIDLAKRVSNRISKTRNIFKKLGNTTNNLYEAEKRDGEYTGTYSIVAEEELIMMVLKKVTELIG